MVGIGTGLPTPRGAQLTPVEGRDSSGASEELVLEAILLEIFEVEESDELDELDGSECVECDETDE